MDVGECASDSLYYNCKKNVHMPKGVRFQVWNKSILSLLPEMRQRAGSFMCETRWLPESKCLATGWLASFETTARRWSPNRDLKSLPVSLIEGFSLYIYIPYPRDKMQWMNWEELHVIRCWMPLVG